MRDSILKSIFFRSDKKVRYSKWLKLTLLESYLGEQLLEMLLSFSSYTKNSDFDGMLPASSNGYKTTNLEDFIAATLINRWLCKHIKELLEIKYLNHYGVLRSCASTEGAGAEYEVNPEKLYMLTELRLSYNTIWVSINLAVDVIVYVFSGNLVAALTTGAVVEFVRRFKF